jgi:ERCC4-type nuclease
MLVQAQARGVEGRGCDQSHEQVGGADSPAPVGGADSPAPVEGADSPAPVGGSIEVDVRERALLEAFARAGAAVASRQLDVGDVVLRCGERELVIERKTLQDWAASIKDGRYREQLARIAGTRLPSDVIYVIEGMRDRALARFDGPGPVPGPGSVRASKQPRVGGISVDALRGSAVSIMVKYGHGLVFTEDVDDTAAFILRASKKLAECGGASQKYELNAAAACAARKKDNMTPRQCFLQQLCQIPGLSSALAQGIVDALGVSNMCGLVRALSPLDPKGRRAFLQRAPKVGRGKADSVLTFLGFDE